MQSRCTLADRLAQLMRMPGARVLAVIMDRPPRHSSTNRRLPCHPNPMLVALLTPSDSPAATMLHSHCGNCSPADVAAFKSYMQLSQRGTYLVGRPELECLLVAVIVLDGVAQAQRLHGDDDAFVSARGARSTCCACQHSGLDTGVTYALRPCGREDALAPELPRQVL